MGLVSFLSTVPTLLPNASLPSTYNPSKCPGTISCKLENNAGGSNETNGVKRRDILNCFGAAISMANQELIPSILSLALNDSMTYDKPTKTGGPNGSIRFSSEINRPENKGLSAALSLVEEAKKEIDSYSKGGPISYSDLIQLAAQSALKATFLASAIRKCGGNEEKGNLLYSAYGSSGQWGLFDRQFGRSDTQEPDPEGRVPNWSTASVQEMKDKFIAIGFGPRQLAVMSAFLGPDQLANEAKLATDPDVTKWVEKYQRSRETVSETDYEVSTHGHTT
ncbi:thylakoid lumenal 29 kDa protein, chloroplastic [Tanacetum coccineum]|uniref:Thylakoid lumenal 29 kDa protein, chloroplastic n=1 Tax=Tanacetum coccineum TaxID=301880 RepID=A0ABQ5IR44_9ASTR